MEGDWNGATGANKYQYNGKELNSDFGLEWNDYGARFYDPAVARWGNIDPKSEKYYSLNPYNYVGNMPTIAIDPTGKEIVVPNKEDQKIVLAALNEKAAGKFNFDADNKLYYVIDANEATHSAYYRDRLREAIDDPQKITVIKADKLIDKSRDGKKDIEYDVDEQGGSATTGEIGTDQTIYFSGREGKDFVDSEGNPLKYGVADLLLHEFLGHAIPRAVSSDTGNAVKNENKAREQSGDKTLRKNEPNHDEDL